MKKEKCDSIIDNILSYEHSYVAAKLKLIEEFPKPISDEVLFSAISLIDELSLRPSDEEKKIIITLSAILWTYQQESWSGLNSFLVKILCRIGFAPSTLMLDKSYDFKAGEYSSNYSWLDQLAIAVDHLKREILVKERVFLLTNFQKEIWHKIDAYRSLGISAPTSAGKSFILGLKAIDFLLKNDGIIIYIVPTLSLVSQVSVDFRRLVDEFGLGHYEILNTFIADQENNNKIYVLTQEKAIGAFSQKKVPFDHIRMLIVDEIQNIERVSASEEQRAKTLYDLLIEFRHTATIDSIVISGPRIEGIGDLCDNLFGGDAGEQSEKSSPVASFTYSIVKKGKSYYFNQHTDIIPIPKSLPFVPSVVFPNPEGSVYNAKYHRFMYDVLSALGDEKNIIFSPTAPQARKTAIALSKFLDPVENPKVESLISYLKETVHESYSLCEALSKGIAYHHGKIPHHVRRSVEKAINDKIIGNVVCTTTLMQGVNLPAQNVILRNPNLYIKKNESSAKLTQYEIANLRGRAGRLLKDFIGRTYVLDENAFEESSDSTSKFEDNYKLIPTGYGETFAKYKKELKSDLFENRAPQLENKSYNFLLSYIRQMIINHGEYARSRFRVVGVDITDEEYNKISNSLADLTIPKKICSQNRYWDPVDLDRMQKHVNDLDLPSSVNESEIAYKLNHAVRLFKAEFPSYANRYFKIDHDGLIDSICISAEKWLKEKSLKDILSEPYYDTADKIEDTIERLQNNVSYGLPLLLKPMYDMKHPDKSFLRFIEAGAFKPVTRRLIEYNIPRETAIYLERNYLAELAYDQNFDEALKDLLRKNFNNFSYWVQAQLEALLPASKVGYLN